MPKTLLDKPAYDVAMGTAPIESLLDAYPDRDIPPIPGIEHLDEADQKTLKAFALWLQLADEGRVKEEE